MVGPERAEAGGYPGTGSKITTGSEELRLLFSSLSYSDKSVATFLLTSDKSVATFHRNIKKKDGGECDEKNTESRRPHPGPR